MKNVLILFFCITLFVVACCPKSKSNCPAFTFSEEQWEGLGFDSTNIALDLVNNNNKVSHKCVFKDEDGNPQNLVQNVSVSFLPPPFCEWGCCNNCGSTFIECKILDTIKGQRFVFQPSSNLLPNIYHVEIDKFSFQINKFTDTLHNFPIQNDTFATVFRYQIDSSLVPIDSVWLKTIYFAPKKGIVKLDFKQNQFWERVN